MSARRYNAVAEVEFVSSQQAADLCSVDRRTLLRWIDRGLLASHQPGGGRHRILCADLRRFIREHDMPMPPALVPTPRVGIVDDDPPLVRGLRRIVRQHWPTAAVETASDGFAAGVLVASLRPHVLLLDIQMPGISGIEVCRRLTVQPDLAGTSVVVVSGALTPAIEAELSRLGAKRCIPKPFAREQIIAALDDFLPGAERR
jgi:excisionase family DNA binding protein